MVLSCQVKGIVYLLFRILRFLYGCFRNPIIRFKTVDILPYAVSESIVRIFCPFPGSVFDLICTAHPVRGIKSKCLELFLAPADRCQVASAVIGITLLSLLIDPADHLVTRIIPVCGLYRCLSAVILLYRTVSECIISIVS